VQGLSWRFLKRETMNMKRVFLVLAFIGVVVALVLIMNARAEAIDFSPVYVGNTIVDIEWTEYHGEDFDEYRLYRDEALIESYHNITDSFHRDGSNLTVNQSYSYRIDVVNVTDIVVNTSSFTITTGEVRGVIILDTSWEEGEYRLAGNLVVAANATFTVGSGVDIYTGVWSMVVQGNISDLHDVSFHGKGLAIDGKQSSMNAITLENCNFTGEGGGQHPGTALSLRNIGVLIKNCSIEHYDYGVVVDGDECSLTGTTIRDTTETGIMVSGDGYYLGDNTVETNGTGIEISGSNGLVDNTTVANSSLGILIHDQYNVTVTSCEFKGNNYGLVFHRGYDLVAAGNTFAWNTNRGIYLNRSTGALITGNSFEGLNGIYMLHATGITAALNTFVGNEGTGISIYGGGKNTIESCQFSGSGIGVFINTSDENELIDNTIELSGDTGIIIKGARENLITGGVVDSAPTAIYLEESDHNIIEDVEISSGLWGELRGVVLALSDHNELANMKIHNMSTSTGRIIGVELDSYSRNNSLHHITIGKLSGKRACGVVAGSSLNSLRSIEIRFVNGEDFASGIELVGNDNTTLSSIQLTSINSSKEASGLFIDRSGSTTVLDCTISQVNSTDDRGAGLRVNNSRNITVRDSSLTHNDIGILSENGSNPGIHWCTIVSNTYFGMVNADDGVTVSAWNNWWGHKGGPGGAGDGDGDKVSDHVDYEPWMGAAPSGKHVELVSAGSGIVDATGETDTAIYYDTNDDVTITILNYESNPGAGFEGDVGKYIDVHIDDSSGVRSLHIKMYYSLDELKGKDETNLKLSWWDGGMWTLCSGSGVSTVDTGGYAGYIWADIREDTTPSLAEMTGTPFGAIETEEEVHTITVTIDDILGAVLPGNELSLSGTITIEPVGNIRKVKLYLDGVYQKDATFTPSSYTTTLTLPSNLSWGDHTLMVEVLLESGEFGTGSGTITYISQATKHTITITIDTIGEEIEPGESITVSGTIGVDPEAAIQEVRILFNGTEIAMATVNGSRYSSLLTLPSNLSEGNHTITVNVTLETGESAGKSVTIDYEEEEEEDEVSIGLIIGVVVVLVVAIIAVLVNMGFIPPGAKTGDEEKVPTSLPGRKKTDTKKGKKKETG